MNCLKPIILKSGLSVPCGKCELCRSNNRNEWSIRLAVHLCSCDRMPMFITLTYDDKHLVYSDDGLPTLHRPHVSAFLKAYKRKYNLTNETFQYFGCGEYGENYHRPHYHLLFFGDFQLYQAFFDDIETAQNIIRNVWSFGFVHVGVAGFDGIHYVTKYCLKEDLNLIPDSVVKPFTIASKGLGMNYLNSVSADKVRYQLNYLHYHADEINKNAPAISEDFSNLDDVLRYYERYVPNFKVILDDGRIVFLPRAIRRKLVGSFEHFKDSPLWYYNHLRTLNESIKYYRDYSDYDDEHEISRSLSACLTRVEKIRKRLLENKYNSKIKTL